jgi:subfamily B ATP-binding cassette protein MsbA
MQELLAKQPSITSGEVTLQEPISSVEFENISLRYGEKEALKNISLSVKKGESIALVGDSGAGKSSLVNLLVRFYDPTEGSILINQQPNHHFTLPSLHQKVAYVTQRIYLFNDTIASNVAYGEEIDEARVIEALSKAYALEFVEALPQGIYTPLLESGNNLSGGQRQRIALARALYKEPDILILDEATSALDNRSEALIQKALLALKPNLITFTVAHRLSTIESADMILLFQEGEIVAQGTHETLLELSPLYRNLAQKH